MNAAQSLPARMLDPRLVRWVPRRLLAWFRRHARKLPWRSHPHPYRVWISEIMLQQTQVATVLPYYRRWLRRFPTVRSLAQASQGEVLKAWEGLGYYSRARNLHQAACRLVRTNQGRLPDTAAGWQMLPGIGPYTANAIASISRQERVPVVDGNVSRVWARFFKLAGNLEEPAVRRRLWDLAERLLPAGTPGDFNQAVMELGALVCQPRNPRCAVCPLSARCRARIAGQQERYPRRRPRRAVPHHEVAAAVIKRGDRYLLGRRPDRGLLGGLWEFPGGKTEPGETLGQALERELEEELGVRARAGRELVSVDHAYTHFTVTVHALACTLGRQKPRLKFHHALRWATLADMRRLAFPRANHAIIAFLRKEPRKRSARIRTTGVRPESGHSRFHSAKRV
ncbi:MAG: A/G-specific adenine glycosylase [candidate division FCPU426 bacterium]